jgi:hypothetical protein
VETGKRGEYLNFSKSKIFIKFSRPSKIAKL